jgi:hypothetical protein
MDMASSTIKMVLAMRVIGWKICSMGLGMKSGLIKLNIRGNIGMEKGMGRESLCGKTAPHTMVILWIMQWKVICLHYEEVRQRGSLLE